MITIYWMTQSRRQLPEGGDETHNEFEELLVEGYPRESYTTRAEMTEHPIEQSADISDHTIPKPRELELECVIGGHIFSDRIEFDPDRPNTVVQQIDELILSGTPVDIETQRGLFENFQLLERTEERTIEVGDAARFVLRAKELFIATLEQVEAPSPQVERARPRRDAGRQNTTATNEQVTADRSPASREQVRTGLAAIADSLR